MKQNTGVLDQKESEEEERTRKTNKMETYVREMHESSSLNGSAHAVNPKGRRREQADVMYSSMSQKPRILRFTCFSYSSVDSALSQEAYISSR